jgi:UDP-N-acetylglucosamine 4,6-dehydratase
MNLQDILRDRTVLITGGTGSFGHAVVERFLKADVGEIRILSAATRRSRRTCAIHLSDRRAKFYIGDVREPGSVYDAMRGVDFVFHAAALKQVPSCEFYPMEAVRTNVLGAENVIDAAVAARWARRGPEHRQGGLSRSTPWACPRRLMEKLTIAKSRSARRERYRCARRATAT